MNIDEIAEAFRDEAEERLDDIVQGLLALESGTPFADVIAGLFRDAHSIKGGAGMMGFDNVYELAHAVEDVLGVARRRSGLPTALVDPLLRAADLLRQAVHGAAVGTPEASAALAAAAEAAFAAEPDAPAPDPDEEPGSAGDRASGAGGSPAAEARPPEAAGNGASAGAGGVSAGGVAAAPAAGDPSVKPGGDTGPGEPAEPTGDGGSAQPAGDGAPAGRAPAGRASIRVDAAKVDRVLDTVGETVLHHNRLEHEFRTEHGGELLDEGEALLADLQDAAIELRTVPLDSIAGRFPRGVREVAAAEGKEVEFTFEDTDAQVDRALLDGTSEAITHLLRNAVAHGIELPEDRERAGKPRCGRVELRAEARGDRVAIEVEDDGRGVAPDLLHAAESRQVPVADLLSEPGFSTSADVSGLAGRGVGLDAVRSHVEGVGGSFDVQSVPGRGTTFTLLLPVSVALLQVLILSRGDHVLGVPVAAVSEVTIAGETVSLGGRSALVVRGASVPTADLLSLLGGSGPPLPDRPPALVLRARRPIAALCDHIRGEEEVIVKPLGPLLRRTPGYLGAALLGDGSIALIVEPGHLAVAHDRAGHAATAAPAPTRAAAEGRATTVLVVDDQFTVRQLQRSILEAAGYDVQTARDGQEALGLLQAEPRAEAVITDLEMPNMGGFELLEAIRRHPDLAALPVVVVTSRASAEDEQRGLEAGADAYIVKERFDQQALLDTVQRLVGR